MSECCHLLVDKIMHLSMLSRGEGGGGGGDFDILSKSFVKNHSPGTTYFVKKHKNPHASMTCIIKITSYNISNRRHLETKQLVPSLPGIYATGREDYLIKTARPREREREKSNIRTLGRVHKVKSHFLGHVCLIKIPTPAPRPPGKTLIGAL